MISKFGQDNVYSADEAMLYYKVMPWRMIRDQQKNDRFTILLICNMTGEHKLKPVVVGEAKTPACLKRTYGITSAQMKVDWYASKNGWMNIDIWRQVMSKWNNRLKLEQKKVCLLVNNRSYESLKFSQIELVFPPPPKSYLLQPLAMGILRALKQKYQSRMVDRYLGDEGDDARNTLKNMDVKLATDLINECWMQITPENINLCFHQAFEGKKEDQPDANAKVNVIFNHGIAEVKSMTEDEIQQQMLDQSEVDSRFKIHTASQFLECIDQMKLFLKQPLHHLEALEEHVMFHLDTKPLGNHFEAKHVQKISISGDQSIESVEKISIVSGRGKYMPKISPSSASPPSGIGHGKCLQYSPQPSDSEPPPAKKRRIDLTEWTHKIIPSNEQ